MDRGINVLRMASEEDLEEIVRMTADFFNESRWKTYEYSPQRWLLHMAHCQASGFLWVHDERGVLGGYMAGVVGPMMFSEAIVATEIALYVVPEKRTGHMAIALLKQFVAWGKGKGARECVAGSSAGINSEAVRRLYQHMEFNQVGDLMVRRL